MLDQRLQQLFVASLHDQRYPTFEAAIARHRDAGLADASFAGARASSKGLALHKEPDTPGLGAEDICLTPVQIGSELRCRAWNLRAALRLPANRSMRRLPIGAFITVLVIPYFWASFGLQPEASSNPARVRVPHDHAGCGNYPLKIELVNASLSLFHLRPLLMPRQNAKSTNRQAAVKQIRMIPTRAPLRAAPLLRSADGGMCSAVADSECRAGVQWLALSSSVAARGTHRCGPPPSRGEPMGVKDPAAQTIRERRALLPEQAPRSKQRPSTGKTTTLALSS